jgi:Flp pilus assembly pilin Flp
MSAKRDLSEETKVAAVPDHPRRSQTRMGVGRRKMPKLRYCGTHVGRTVPRECDQQHKMKFICRVILQTKCLWLAEDGKDTVEYGLLMVLLSLATITALVMLARTIGIGQATSSSQSTTNS